MMVSSNWVYIYKGHLQSSLKTIFISSIGLVFALAIITSTLVYITSMGPVIFASSSHESSFPAISPSDVNIFPNYKTAGKDFGVRLSYTNSSYTLRSIQSAVSQTIQQHIDALHLASKISSIQSITYVDGPAILLNQTETSPLFATNSIYINRTVRIVEITNALRLELEELNAKLGIGVLPQHGNTLEGYMLYYNDENYNNLYTYYPEQTHSTPLYANYYVPCSNGKICTQADKYNLSISGYANYSSLDYTMYPHLVDVVSQGFDNIGVTLFVNNLSTFWQLVNIPLQKAPNFLHSALVVTVDTTISIQYAALNVYNAYSDLDTFQQLSVQLQDDMNTVINAYQLSLAYSSVNFYSEGVFLAASATASSVLIEVLLYALPIILVALFVANYSFSLIHRNVLQHIGTYKTRGASDILVFFMEVLDIIFMLVIAINGALLLGIPVSSLALHTDNFLSFNEVPNAALVIDITMLLQVLALTGLVLEILLQIIRMIRLARISIAETENPTEQIEPFWKRHYFDIFLFFGGGIGFVLADFIITQYQQAPFLNVVLALGLLTPILLAVGTILFFSRLFPLVLNTISTNLWQNIGGLFAFSMKNVIRHKQASTRAVILIGMLLVFLINFLTIPISYTLWTENTVDYNLGAEGVATLPGITNNYFYNATLLEILETNFSQYFQAITPFLKIGVRGTTVDTLNTIVGHLLAINTSTFLSAADIPVTLGTKNSLQTDMQRLESTNFSLLNILGQEQFITFHGITIGKTLTYLGLKQQSYQFTFIDTFSRWPNLFDQYLNYNGQTLYGVISITPFLSTNTALQNSIYSIDTSGLYFKFKNGVNQTLVAQLLKNDFSLSLTLLNQEIYTVTHQISNLVIVGQINADIIMSFLIGGAILLMFAWLQLIERRREMFTERALGMKLYQISALFLAESFILLVSGIIIGTFMGGGLSEMITIFITFGPSLIPYVPYYPLDLIGESLFILIFLAVIGAIIPAIIVTKLDISRSFAGER